MEQRIELSKVNEALSLYLRPQTFPVALRMCQSSQEFPERVRIPVRDLKIRIAACQAIGMARRYGWTVAVGKEDQSCPFGSLILGFLPAKEGFLKGEFHESLSTGGAGEVAARTAQAMRRLGYGKYNYLLAAPVQATAFEPHLIVIYGNSAQMLRLVQGSLYGRGGALTFSSMGDAVCADIIAGTMLSGECQLGLPCMGDRIFGLSQNDELAFAIPWSKVGSVIAGLEASHKAGQRYPVPSFLRFEPQWPPSYYKLMDYLEKR
jgi:uncharacterized protein (DUF169 family)